MRSIPTLALLFLTLATPALGSDGVLEINQICAQNAGCFSGDTAGFPVTISASGSYRLTSNLAVDQYTTAIVVSTNDVGIDLNNFAIVGSVTCSGRPLVCTSGLGTGSGVERVASSNRGISVKNGSITGMGNYGVQLGEQAEVTNLRVRWNRYVGISVGAGSTVSGNTAFRNGGGIFATSESTVSGNTANQNGSEGIFAGLGSNVSGNTSNENGTDGIFAVDGSTVQRNTVSYNGRFGLSVLASTYRENTITGNSVGPVSGGVSLGDNYCAGAGTVSVNCP